MTYRELRDEIIFETNKFVNKMSINKHPYIDVEIQSIIGDFLDKNYHHTIRNWRVISEYPKLEIYIEFHAYGIEQIPLLKFERKNKLKKLNMLCK